MANSPYTLFTLPAAGPPTPPPPPPPAAGGSAPGKLGKGRRKSGPTMREGQVFGEQYAVSPQAGPQMPGRDAKGRFVRGMRVKMEMLPREGDNPPAWSIYLDTTFTDLDE